MACFFSEKQEEVAGREGEKQELKRLSSKEGHRHPWGMNLTGQGQIVVSYLEIKLRSSEHCLVIHYPLFSDKLCEEADSGDLFIQTLNLCLFWTSQAGGNTWKVMKRVSNWVCDEVAIQKWNAHRRGLIWLTSLHPFRSISNPTIYPNIITSPSLASFSQHIQSKMFIVHGIEKCSH